MWPQQKSGDYEESQWQVKFGTGTDRTRLVAALEWRDRGTLKWRDRPAYNDKQYGSSSTGNPGTWSVPTRNADGTLGAPIRLADPGCGVNHGPGGTNLNAQRNHMTGRPTEFRADGRSQRCRLEFGEFWDFNTDLEHYTAGRSPPTT